MAKATWKGAIKIGFLTIPVAAISVAESSEKISFNQLHKGCNARINQKKVCSACAAEVKNEDLVKGYEHVKGQYVVLTEAEIASVKVPSERTVNLTSFPEDTVDPLLIAKSYFMVPDGPVAVSSYHVIKAALEGRTGVGRICMNGSEKQVVIEPRGRGMLMHVLHEVSEVRDIANLDQLRTVPVVKQEEVAMARMLMEKLDEPVDLGDFEDSYKTGVRRMIEARIKGEEIVVSEEAAPAAPAGMSLADMLKSSLEAVETLKPKKQAKASLPEPAAQPVAMAAHKAPRRKKTA